MNAALCAIAGRPPFRYLPRMRVSDLWHPLQALRRGLRNAVRAELLESEVRTQSLLDQASARDEQLSGRLDGIEHAHAAQSEMLLNEVRTHVSSMQTDTAERLSRLESIQADLGEIFTSGERRLNSAHDVLVARIEAHQSALINDLEEATAALATRVEAVEVTTAKQLDVLQSSLGTRLDRHHSTLTGRISHVEAELGSRLDAQDGTIAERLHASETGLTNRLSAMQATLVSRLAGTEVEVSSRLAAVEKNLAGRLEAAEAAASDRLQMVVEAVVGSNDVLEGAPSFANEKLTSAVPDRAAETSLARRVGGLASHVNEIMAQLDRTRSELSDRLNSHTGDRLMTLDSHVARLLDLTENQELELGRVLQALIPLERQSQLLDKLLEGAGELQAGAAEPARLGGPPEPTAEFSTEQEAPEPVAAREAKRLHNLIDNIGRSDAPAEQAGDVRSEDNTPIRVSAEEQRPPASNDLPVPLQGEDGLAMRARALADFEFDLSGSKRTRMCTLPFHSPTQEPDGAVRLCCASSTFGYAAETDMGNHQTAGLAEVWRGDKYRHVRKSLLSGDQLEPYCASCEYRHPGEAWMLQLHLALDAWHSGVQDDETVGMIRRWASRYDEYAAGAADVSLGVFAMPELPEPEAGIPIYNTKLPEPLIDAGDLPVYVDFNTLNRCNVSCVMCPPAILHDDKDVERDHYWRLSIDEFDEACEGLNVKTAHFVGAYAEPLLNKDIFKLIKRAHDEGAFTAITTNATILIPRFAERLIDSGLDMMTVSLHGATKGTAESIMRKADFDRVISNIRNLQAEKAKRGTNKPEIYFNFVSQLANVKEIPDFISLAADLGVNHVHLIHLIDGGLDDKSTNLVYYPELLGPAISEAKRRAAPHSNVNMYISPAYAEIVTQYEAETQQPLSLSRTSLSEGGVGVASRYIERGPYPDRALT